MQDIKLNTAGDVDLSFHKLTLVSGSDQVAQRLSIALKLFLGEWNFDTTKGVPYYEDVFVKGQDPGVLENIFKTAILGVEDVNKLLSFDLSLEERVLTLVFTVDTTYGIIDLEEIL